MMSWDFNQGSRKQQNKIDNPYAEFEMCDVCCHTYHYSSIRRFRYINNYGTVYIIRCCVNCNVEQLTPYL